MRKRLTRSDHAWSNFDEKLKPPKLSDPIKNKILSKDEQVVPVSLDVKAVADAINTHLVGPVQSISNNNRTSSDEKLIMVLSIGICVLSVTSLFCALICIIVVASTSRTISKLELLLR